jgi:hypothetical protein
VFLGLLSASGCWLTKVGQAESHADSGTGAPMARIAGTAAVPGAAGRRLRLVAQSLDGDPLASADLDGTGGFSLELPPGQRGRVLLSAIDPANPEARAYRLIDLPDPGATTTAALPDGVMSVDADSTAETVAMAALGRLREGPRPTAHAAELAELKAALASGPARLCSGAPAPGSTGALRKIVDKAAADAPVPSLVRDLIGDAGSAAGPAARLTAMQRRISQRVRSVNNRQLLSNPTGFLTLVTERMAIGAFTGETINSITGEPVSQGDLGYLAGVIAGGGWGNCREKAFMAAFAASLVPEVQQLAVVGLSWRNGGNHAVAIACLDGPEVLDLSRFGVFDGQISAAAYTNGRCVVIDPWLGPTDDPTAGHTAVLDATYAERMNWYFSEAVKPVKLDRRVTVPGPSGKSMPDCDCARAPAQPKECAPFAVAPAAPDAGAPDVGAAGDQFSARITVAGMSIPFAPTPQTVGTGWPSGGTRHDPTILAFSGQDPSISPSITLSLNPKVIHGPGSYGFGSVSDFWADKAGGDLFFDPGNALPSTTQLSFTADAGGELHLSSWGDTPGSRVAGDFECTISETHWSSDQSKNVTTTGSITGRFDVTLSAP